MCVILFIVCVLFHRPSMQYSEDIFQMEDATVEVGEDVTFRCFHSKDLINRVMWYKQAMGERPVLVASSYFWTQNSTLYDDFKNSKRFKVTAWIGNFNLTIKKAVQSDSATYYCSVSYSNLLYFGAGTNLVVRGSESNRVHILQQPQSGSSRDGNVTLFCNVRREQESCGENNVYWFRPASGRSHPGILYSQESCRNRLVAASPYKSSDCNLSIRNIKPADVGTYYCAVVTCGEVLFGRGIHLAVNDEYEGQHVKFYFLIGLASLLTISLVSSVLLCVKGNKYQEDHNTNNLQSSLQFNRDCDLTYASIKFTSQRSRQPRETRERQT